MPNSSKEKSSGASIAFDLLYFAAGVLLLPYFLIRRLKGKKSAPRAAKMAHVSERKGDVERLWIHAVSVGEANAAEPLVKALKAARPQAEIVMTTTTVTGQGVAAKKYGAENVLYYPHDFSWVVRRFLDRVKPSILILMELEVWPNMTAECAARGIPIVVVNARITKRSAKRYAFGQVLVGPAFRRVDLWLAQTEEYAERLKTLGVSAGKIEIPGNIKYDAIDTAPPDPAARKALRAELGIDDNAPVLIGGSTHPSEEAALLDAVKRLRATSIPNLRLILVPRHPERQKTVETEIDQAGFMFIKRSDRLKSPPAAQLITSSPHPIILIDTMGELKKMYAAADVAFVGGSLIPHGGQNIMEPCGMGVPSVHGPHMHNFNEAMEILRSVSGAIQVTRESLSGELEKLFADRTQAAAMARRAREAFLKKQGATGVAVKRIEEVIRR